MVVVAVAVVSVAPTQVKGSAVAHGLRGQVAAVDGVAVKGVANHGGVNGGGGVVLRAVQAPGAKWIPVQMGLPAALPHVRIAPIRLAHL